METTLLGRDRGALRAWTVSVVQALAGAYFVAGGWLALTGAPVMLRAFARLGWPGPMRALVAIVELVAGTAIVFDRWASRASAALLALVTATMLVHVARGQLFPDLVEGLVTGMMLVAVNNAFAGERGEPDDGDAGGGLREMGDALRARVRAWRRRR